MAYEEKTECKTSYYRCLDPIENLKIRVVIQAVKNVYIPLPKFEVEETSPTKSSDQEESQSIIEEYTFKWQEKIFNKNEIKKYSSEPDWKKKIHEKYHNSYTDALSNLKNYPRKLFSYVEVDNYVCKGEDLNIFKDNVNYFTPLKRNFDKLNISSQNVTHFKNIPKRKIINYNPSKEFKKQNHGINNNVQRMFIMMDLGPKEKSGKKEMSENDEYILCALSYNYLNNVLEMTPSFCEGDHKPYNILSHLDGRNSYNYWLYHASLSIPVENLTKEINIMTKVFDHQEELRKLQVDSDFSATEPNCLYVTILGEITSAQDFEYDQLYIRYFIKLPSGWGYNNISSLSGTTHTSNRSPQGICHFSYLFEMNIFKKLDPLEDTFSAPPEIFFEVLSIDKYNRYRNEGYTYVFLPERPGMFKYNLKCWRVVSKTIRSQLERFFIGGGPELEDPSFVGLSTTEKADVMNRLGLETVPSGQIDFKLNILQQCETFKLKKGVQPMSERSTVSRVDADSLLSSINIILEAFRRARERMLEAKQGLETDSVDFNFKSVRKLHNRVAN